ncbi:hypothetical protein G4Y79_20570 [Phototrophicus methaneseepsis]|uniref:WD40 repeat domain-containing protein n=1 Tax=Phototrophicus methaneseepsis TaxID=2710758 RepID=A0A7S8E816_9CHLR|nr:hypothetical protein [Phototrophicus methaneseepsis]QPC82054.1 hypothetical protein G4Y79_20570 [Phototrophicus methaneseepsis]
MPHSLRIALSLLILIVSGRDTFANAPKSSYIYLYVSDTTGETFTLNFLDTVSLTLDHQIQLAKPISFGITAFLSPDGKWVAFLPATPSETIENIILYDILNNETRSVPAHISANFLFDSAARVWGPSPSILWSPDSMKLAFIGQINGDFTLGVYEINTDETLYLPNTGSKYANLAWNSTSDELAVTAHTCDPICQPSIEIYNIPGQYLVSSTNVLGPHGVFYPEYMCNLQWSPDSMHISLVSFCGFDSFEDLKEVYILDRQTSTLINATHLTDHALPMTDPPNPELVGRFAAYDTLWISDDTIIIGATYSETISSNRIAKTFLYNLNTQTLTSIGDVRGDEFALSASQIAISTSNSDETLQDVRIVSLSDIASLQTQNSHLPGCQLDWHPIDNVLAYTNHGDAGSYCRDPIQSLVFIDDDGMREYPISDIVPIGWVSPP